VPTGGTTVFEASLYGEYAGVYIPADPTGKVVFQCISE
jgi:hypothetical protein